MAFINILKVNSRKIYRVDNLLINNSKRKSPVVNLTLTPNAKVSDFVALTKAIRNVPNQPLKILAIGKAIKPETLAVRNRTVVKQNTYKELKNAKVVFNRIASLESFENSKKFSNKANYVDLSIFRDAYNKFAVKKKKSEVTGYKFFKEFLLKNVEDFKSRKFTVNTYVTLPTDLEEPFIKAIYYAITRKEKEIFPILESLHLFFITTDSHLLFRPDFSTVSNKALIKTLLDKMFRMHKDFLEKGQIDDDADVENVFDIVASPVDSKMYNDSLVMKVDGNDDKDEEEVDSDVNDESDESENDSDSEPEDTQSATFFVKDVSKNTDDIFSIDDEKDEKEATNVDDSENIPSDEPEEVESNVNVDDLNDGNLEEDESVLDLDEILPEKSLELINTRIQEENKEFLEKNMHLQLEALKEFEAEASLLAENKSLQPILIDDPNIINYQWKNVLQSSITSSYYKNQYKKDVLDIITSLNNDPDEPVVITKFEIKDNSDTLNRRNEYTIEFMDKRKKRHKFVVDVPILSNDNFLLINGNKRFIARQAFVVPVIKENNDSVLITTNYRKTFIYRKGDKINGQIDRILRLVADKKVEGITKNYGNSYTNNLSFDISIPYNFLSQRLFKFEVDSGFVFILSQETIRRILKENNFSCDFEKYIPVGYRLLGEKINTFLLEDIATREIFELNKKGDIKKYSPSLTDVITQAIETSTSSEVKEAFRALKPVKSLSYSEVKIVSTSVALGVLIASFKGILPALDMYGIDYRLEDKRVAKRESEIILTFKDTYLYIDSKYQASKELFANGLLFLDTNDYKLDECTRMAPVFLEYFDKATGSRNTAKALTNFENSMIDPITKDVLEHFSLPIVFSELLLYANDMLGSYKRSRKNDMNHYRIRDSECIAVALYNSLTDAFNNYKRTLKSGMPQTISVRKDDVTRRIQSFINVEDFSTLNPFQEIEVKSKMTFKGPSGINSSDSYTLENKAYDESMLGICGIYTPISAEVGVNRSMVVNPVLDSNRGYITKKDVEKLESVQLFSMGELLNVFTPTHADAPRVVMATVQGKHLTPTKIQDPYLVGSGADKALAYIIGQSFAFKASENGKITEIDEEKQLCTITYNDGTHSVVDFSPQAAKNSGGGFYIQNKLDLRPEMKVGKKVKKGEIIAIDNSFFKNMLDGSVGFAAGRLTKMALIAQPETYEDSGIITDAMIEDMSSEVINERMVTLKKNTRISRIVKIGDEVDVNDPLVEFEEVGDGEAEALAALERMDSDTQDMINSRAFSSAKAKYTGEIFDIQIFYNTPIEEMEPSLAKIVKDYNAKYEEKSKKLEKVRSDEIVRMNSTKMIESEKLFGQDVDGVVIKFYIKFRDKMKVGDKMCFYTSLKTIVAKTIPKGLEPYSEYRPTENVDAFLSPLSVVSRMTIDLFLMGYTNKLILELENKCVDILSE
ncbi:hypothetical protein [Proteus mirabilis]|uniref:hypothetical protein n=1 Tax=Proteus mirabilis TaxID=584 RepID=UPI0034D73E66